MNPSTLALTRSVPSGAMADAPASTSAAPSSGHGGSWSLVRRGSIAPRQLLSGLAALCAISLVIGIAFWWNGAGPVLAFAGLEWLVVAILLTIHARHVGDGEAIVLSGQFLLIESRRGAAVSRWMIGLEGSRVVSPRDDRCPVVIQGQGKGQSVGVGLQVPYPGRVAFARELRRAIQAAKHG